MVEIDINSKSRAIFGKDLEASEKRIIADYLKKSPTPENDVIALQSIYENTKNKDLVIRLVENLNKYDTKTKAQILWAVYKLSGDKMNLRIENVVSLLEKRELDSTLAKYKELNCLTEIIFRIGRLSSSVDKKEMKTMLEILADNKTIDVIKRLKEQTKNELDFIISAGEVVNLIANSKKEDFLNLRNDLVGIIKKIKEEYNITHFGRFSAKLLNELDEMINKKSEQRGNEKLFVFAYAYSDPNGAFYNDSKNLDLLMKHGKLIVIEAKTDVELMLMLEKMNKKYGNFDGLFIAGHGQPTEIKLGEKSDYSSLFDITDFDIAEKIGNMMNKTGSDFIAFISCSTGNEQTSRSIANMVAAATKSSFIFAPETPFTNYKINIQNEENVSNEKTKRNSKWINITYYKAGKEIPTMENKESGINYSIKSNKISKKIKIN